MVGISRYSCQSAVAHKCRGAAARLLQREPVPPDTIPTQGAYTVLPDWQMAMRNDHYKLVRLATTDYDPASDSCATTTATEFYAIDERVPPKLDNAERNLLAPPHRLNAVEWYALVRLALSLGKLLDSEVPCPGDGNLDGIVDLEDINQFNYWANVTNSMSSWYDSNLDGRTNQEDVPYITDGQFPRKCARSRWR